MVGRSLVLVVVAAAICAACAGWGNTWRVSIADNGSEGSDRSYYAAISADGRFVAFTSLADDLVPGDTNGCIDVFVRDRTLRTTQRVSLSSTGEQGSGHSSSLGLSISADGRFVAFESAADNLVPYDINGSVDVFVRDCLLGETECVSVSSAGEQGNWLSGWVDMSADGRYVVFQSWANNLDPLDTNGGYDVFLHDRLFHTTELVSIARGGSRSGNSHSGYPSVTPDGRFVAFSSAASDLVQGDRNSRQDAFLRDRLTGTTELLSVSSTGAQGNANSGEFWRISVSDDGQLVAFTSSASNLVPDDDNGEPDIFVRDRVAATTQLVSVSIGGGPGDVRSVDPMISGNGRAVLFTGVATDLVPNDTNGMTDVFVRDLLTGGTQRVSVTAAGGQGNGGSTIHATISADGRFAAFVSEASNLVVDDTNDEPDAFVHDCEMVYRAVSGAVTFAGLDASAPPPDQVTLRVRCDGEDLPDMPVDLGPGGTYTVTVPPGEIELSAKHTHWLRRTVMTDTTGGDQSGVDLSLANGDAVPDNEVNLQDASLILVLFGQSDPYADLNQDGVVDLRDLLRVLLNFGLVGDS
jgi:Tol biopolymer transport system component